MTERDRRLPADRRWPGTRAANVDMLLIGPGGVFAIDVKNWRAAPEVVKGRLWAGGWAWDGHVGKLLDVTKSAERAVGSHGLSPVAVQPLMVFAGRRLDARLGSIRLLGEREVGPVLPARPAAGPGDRRPAGAGLPRIRGIDRRRDREGQPEGPRRGRRRAFRRRRVARCRPRRGAPRPDRAADDLPPPRPGRTRPP
ncbi:nuclease-related domain-containing protein [Streptomyces luteireticuli]|uniref:nuclease-related domain-containing protein n=1 Tax=Streptomyces luteireticuli TaxID=173858 RepID=UPI0035591AB6